MSSIKCSISLSPTPPHYMDNNARGIILHSYIYVRTKGYVRHLMYLRSRGSRKSRITRITGLADHVNLVLTDPAVLASMEVGAHIGSYTH